MEAVACGGQVGKLVVLDASGKALWARPHSSAVTSLAFSPDSKRLVVACAPLVSLRTTLFGQAQVEVWDVAAPAKPIRRLPGQSRRPAVGRPCDTRPRRAPRHRLPRGRYLVAGAATLAVLGIGSAAFAAGSEPRSLPRVAPSIEQFAVEHALTSGDVPLPAPPPAQSTSGRP